MQAIDNNDGPRSICWPIDDVMDIAARLAAHDAVGAIHIAVSERPTYDALLNYRQRAEASGLTMTVQETAIVLRPHRQVGPSAPDNHRVPTRRWWGADVWREVRQCWRAFRDQGASTKHGS
jgi:hypothetical protein